MNVNKYSVVGIATRYRLDGPGIESRCGARSSAEPRLAPRHIPASYTSTMGAGSFPRVKWPDRSVVHASPSSAGVKERVEYTSTPLLGLPCLFKDELKFYFLCLTNFLVFDSMSKLLSSENIFFI